MPFEQYYTINEPDQLLGFINGKLKPKEKEKKDNGEVFTPLYLVNEMVNRLDESYIKKYGKSIFSEPQLKWFDPAVGIGNFPIIVYQRLMNGLKLEIPNEETRRRHILENMLYMSELTPKNVFVCSKIFCGDTYKINLYEGDTLQLNTYNVWGIDKFDIILGNPPFQKKVGDRKTQPMWHLFVINALSKCKDNGNILLVHPSGWRSPEGVFKPILELIMRKNLKYLCMNDFKKGQEVFHVGTNFDYYVLENKYDSDNVTLITDIHGKTYDKKINNWKFIPSGGFDLYENILATGDEPKVNVLYDRSLYGTDKLNMSLENTEGDESKPCVYTITQKDGVKYYYSSMKNLSASEKEKHLITYAKKNMFVPKVIWSNGLGTYPVIDSIGKYGLTQFSYAIIDNVRNLKYIETALNNKSFIELMEYVKFQNNKYNHKVIALLKHDFWKEFTN